MSFFPHASLVIGLVLALATAAAFNWSWVAQHSITSKLPRLELRRPMWSLKLLFAHRRWLVAFLVGVVGWVFYVVALRLAPLSLVQSVSAGGLGLLGVFAQRASGESLPRREWVGVGMAIVGLVFLSVSLADASTHAQHGTWSRARHLVRSVLGRACWFSSARSRHCSPLARPGGSPPD